MKLIATKQVTYASQKYQVGEEFEAKDSHAKILIALKRASEKPRKKREYQRRDMKAEG